MVMKELLELSGLSKNQDYKVLRPSEIRKSERCVYKVVDVLENDYHSPFSVFLECEDVYNLSSGKTFEGDSEQLLNILEQGKEEAKKFLKERIYTTTIPFHDPIKKQKPTLFSGEQVKIKQTDQTKEVLKVNRDILGKLLSLSIKFQKPINFQEALMYPLCPVPLSLAFPDGTKRSTTKSKLLAIIGPKENAEEVSEERSCETLVVDLIAQFRTISKDLPQTFEELIVRLLNSLPKRFPRVDLVADCYRDFSIKAAEREKRGTSQKILIKSWKTRLPREIAKFYTNGENKNQLIKLTFEFIKENAMRSLSILKCNEIILSGDEFCERVTNENVTVYDDLISNQEEADTKVVLHTLEALRTTNGNVCIRSPSGDTDILVVAIGIITERLRVLIDSGNGDKRKKIWLDSIELSENQRKALIGFHAFSGNDYISAFFRKGKQICWKKMLESEDFVDTFIEVGNSLDLGDQLQVNIEKYVCNLYSSKESNINEARFKIFEKKQLRSKQITDLSNLPPCKRTLAFHLTRANYVAKLWKSSGTAMVDLPSPCGNGWCDDGKIQWTDQIYPEDIMSLLMNDSDDDYNEDEFEDLEDVSETDDESDDE